MLFKIIAYVVSHKRNTGIIDRRAVLQRLEQGDIVLLRGPASVFQNTLASGTATTCYWCEASFVFKRITLIKANFTKE